MFLDKITTTPDRPNADIEALALQTAPIVLYGAGSYEFYVRKYLMRFGLNVSASFVDDGFARNSGINTFEEIKQRFEKFNVVIAFSDFRLARKNLQQKNCNQIAGVFFFDVVDMTLNFSMDYAYVKCHVEQFNTVYEMLCDDLSKKTYTAFLNAKLSGDGDALYDVWNKEQYFPEDIIALSENEIFVDGGAYTGDTLLKFVEKTKNKYSKYYAFEPDPANRAQLNMLVNKQEFHGVHIISKGLWNKVDVLRFAAEGTLNSAISETGSASIEVDTINNVSPDATFIKMDIEGTELDALKGAAETIKKNRPKLAISIYHKPEDLFEIPLFIKSLVPEYRFYLRQHQAVSFDLVLYAVI